MTSSRASESLPASRMTGLGAAGSSSVAGSSGGRRMRGGRSSGTARLSYESRKRRTQLLFVAPAVVFLAAFAVFPIIQLFRMSVSDVRVSNLGSDWQFVGLDNVVRNLGQGAFGGVVINTLLFVAIVTTIGLIGGLAVAILLAKSVDGQPQSWRSSSSSGRSRPSSTAVSGSSFSALRGSSTACYSISAWPIRRCPSFSTIESLSCRSLW